MSLRQSADYTLLLRLRGYSSTYMVAQREAAVQWPRRSAMLSAQIGWRVWLGTCRAFRIFQTEHNFESLDTGTYGLFRTLRDDNALTQH